MFAFQPMWQIQTVSFSSRAEKGHLKKNRKDEKLPPPLPPRYFMFRDIEAGTENFSRANYMGDGPYGQSYWARMDVS